MLGEDERISFGDHSSEVKIFVYENSILFLMNKFRFCVDACLDREVIIYVVTKTRSKVFCDKSRAKVEIDRRYAVYPPRR